MTLPKSGTTAAGEDGTKLSSPSALRNLNPIQDVLRKYLPASGRVLEIASGTGEHIVAHAAAFPHLVWQPTELDVERQLSIRARANDAGLGNLLPVVGMDACSLGWAAEYGPVEAIVLANLLHLISDGEMSVVLDEVAKALPPSGMFFLYGPFLRDGAATSEGDAEFHARLQAQDAAIGYKELDVVASVLEALQLRVTTHAMPANNLLIVARKP